MAFFTSPKEWPLYTDMTVRAWRVAIFACLGAMVFGYDTAWWSGVLGMPAFTFRFGVYDSATETYKISSALTSSGEFFAVVAIGQSSDLVQEAAFPLQAESLVPLRLRISQMLSAVVGVCW